MSDTPVRSAASEFALLGGAPLFSEPVHVGRPNIGDRARFYERMDDILDRRWLSNDGRYVRELEETLCNLLGVRHCVAVCNATVGLEILARALDLRGEVIVPSFTFIATAHALRWLNMTPVFCDVLPGTHMLDPAQAATLVREETSAILGVHLWGSTCEVEPLEQLAKKHQLPLLFDAAHAFASRRNHLAVGSFGDAEVLSFHATKFVNAFEGGAITTQRDDLAERLRLLRNFGFQSYDQVVSVGTNGKMHEASAAMALTNLESLDRFLEVNLARFHAYRSELEGTPGLRLYEPGPNEVSNHQYIVVEVDEARAGVNRDTLQQLLWAENVRARRYFYPGCHRSEPYRSDDSPNAPLPVTDALSDSVLVLPTGTAITEDDIRKICRRLGAAVEGDSSLHQQLRAAAGARGIA